jgi:uncharacterized protein (TIGR00369 family)
VEEVRMETDQQLSSLLALAPYTGTLGIRLRAAAKEEVRAVLAWEERLTTTGGGLHGGAIMSLADTAGTICAFLNLPPGTSTTTIESKTNFFRPARSQVEAVARPLHAGRRIIVVQTDLYGEDGKRIAQTTQTQAVLSE